ncbi:hypothetical protein B5X24_HaOG217050 [Helicoverpa armigera]|uniref:Uncharacterized protein n=1 Tax=Helicoverpa armigera TaxID=29058 RepID=A0A2W1C1L9_HELAM|nr:hypothetical protein B5X24_HaOG217050 [Helicoverpa armigera]
MPIFAKLTKVLRSLLKQEVKLCSCVKIGFTYEFANPTSVSLIVTILGKVKREVKVFLFTEFAIICLHY